LEMAWRRYSHEYCFKIFRQVKLDLVVGQIIGEGQVKNDE